MFFRFLKRFYIFGSMEDDLIKVLTNTDLFSDMNESEITVFLNEYSYKIKRYSKNDVFALAGERVNYLMIVLKGGLIARMVSESGKYIQIDKIDVGRIVAPAMLFGTENIFPVNVIPEGDTLVFFMHKDNFLKAMHKKEQLLYNYLKVICDIHHFLSAKIYSLSLKTIQGKLAEYILHESDQQGGKQTVTLSMSRQELADKFAVARQALSRSLSELEKEGVILVKGKEIEILDRTKLKELE